MVNSFPIIATITAMILKCATGYLSRTPFLSASFRSLSHVDGRNSDVVRKEKKYIVVTGGVISGIGKGSRNKPLITPEYGII